MWFRDDFIEYARVSRCIKAHFALTAIIFYTFELPFFGAFVYRLGREVLNLERGVQLP